jgi:LacI family transcriptional regulator
VFIDCYFDIGEQYNNIGLDDQGGMYRMTKHLLSLGHKKILFIGDQPVLWGVDARRLKGHIKALEGAGIPWTDERYTYVSKDRKRRPLDFDRLTQRLSHNHDTAWMFISDYYAVDAIDYLLDHGFRVPEDISVTGFDDNILAHTIRPRLTTIHQNVSQKAEMAVKTLLELLDGTLDAPFSLTLSTRLIKGQSVKTLD